MLQNDKPVNDPRSILIEEYDYPLPDERIAKHPLSQRDECMLLCRTSAGDVSTHIFKELPTLLPTNSMLVCNNTRVINARLRFRKAGIPQGALIEVFCLEPDMPRDYAENFASTGATGCSWHCFVGNSKRWKQGLLSMAVVIGDREVTLSAERIGRNGNTSSVRFMWDVDDVTFSEIISAVGEIPIPPYLNRSTESTDETDYQTVYSHIDGSVAAPTAGLHFTPALVDKLAAAGIPMAELTLHVGAGTFQPVKSDAIGEHEMHSEFITVSRDLISTLARQERKVIAVGTTSVRTLESLYHLGCRASQGLSIDELPQWYPYEDSHPQLSVQDAMDALLQHLDNNGLDRLIASTRVMIAPGYQYRIVDGLITNFHQPRSTLLLLVSAMIGSDWRRVYDYALADSRFRFLSYGDACLFLR
jgi:S-adenosylmethionine:tRNA ribosyltransferase-isomerase